MPQEEKSGIGATIGAIIVIVIIVLGGLYVWGGKLLQNGDSPATTEDSQMTDLSSQNPSDEVSDISKDLEAVDLNKLDSGIDAAGSVLDTI